MVAPAKTLDFSEAPISNITHKPKSMSPKQIRARARRKINRGKSAAEELKLLYKPVEEWDLQELARGRPRTMLGDFRGRPPGWVTREIYEQAQDRFLRLLKEDMRGEAPGALDIVVSLMRENRTDAKGKPLVPASVRLQAAQWLIEHQVGKPTQRIEADISVKLQAVLAQSMVDPAMPAIGPAVERVISSTPETDGNVWDVDAVDDDE